ncbi:MAG: hypothetical protein ACLQVM_05550 [Terriglobia bacterium]
MKFPQCEREQAVTEMLQCGHWPEACDPALRIHVEHCAVCSEVVLVAQFLREEHASLSADMKLPDAGLVWWKSQLRARREAAHIATRPIALAEVFALACGLASLLAFVVWKWTGFHTWLNRLVNFGHSDAQWFLNLLFNSFQQPFTTLFVASASLLVLFMGCLVYAIWEEK